MSEHKFEVRTPVRCGDTTCAVRPSDFCPHLGSKRFGTQMHCTLFDERIYEHTGGEKAGWAARCTMCLKAEQKSYGE